MSTLILIIAIAVIVITLLGTALVTRRKPKGPSAADEIAVLRRGVDPSAATSLQRDRTSSEHSVSELVETPSKPNFRERLGRARESLALSSLFSRGEITDSSFDELEEALIRSDVGIKTTMDLIEQLKIQAKANKIADGQSLRSVLIGLLNDVLVNKSRELNFQPGAPNVWLFVGVNGVGKTTTIGKIARQQVDGGRTAIAAAGDTFRAAAGEQLETWANRSGIEVVRGQEGGDPGAVIFDAVERAAARKIDLVLADTAGRLQNKTNLMNELAKVRKVSSKPPAVLSEVLLVLDATTGQNGLSQAKEFLEIAGVTGVVLTKLDGTAKGGIAFAIESEFGIPIKLVGLGEAVGDLAPFEPAEYVDALLS